MCEEGLSSTMQSHSAAICAWGVGAHRLIHMVANWIIAVMLLTQSLLCVGFLPTVFRGAWL